MGLTVEEVVVGEASLPRHQSRRLDLTHRLADRIPRHDFLSLSTARGQTSLKGDGAAIEDEPDIRIEGETEAEVLLFDLA